MSWYFAALGNYALFRGRARRKEFWYFHLFFLLFATLLAVVDVLIGTMNAEQDIGLLSGIFVVSMLLPSLSAGVRRMHDLGYSGGWVLIQYIPVVGLVMLIVFAQDGQPVANRFGQNPKADDSIPA